MLKTPARAELRLPPRVDGENPDGARAFCGRPPPGPMEILVFYFFATAVASWGTQESDTRVSDILSRGARAVISHVVYGGWGFLGAGLRRDCFLFCLY